jgi:hypothetical protein
MRPNRSGSQLASSPARKLLAVLPLLRLRWPKRPIHRRQQARGLHVALGARLLHGGARAAHAGVGLQRLVDQASELGVAQLLPPLGQVVRPGRSLRGWPIRPGCGYDHRAAQRLG